VNLFKRLKKYNIYIKKNKKQKTKMKEFIKKKCFEVFAKINDIMIDETNFNLEFSKLDGLSNEIYKVTLISNNSTEIPIKHLFFKYFGKVSSKFIFINFFLKRWLIETWKVIL
jgi:hypothetical protein